MSFLVTRNFRRHNAEQLKESVVEAANTTYFVFAGKPTSYANGSIPQPIDSVESVLYNTYEDMVFGKRVADSDVALMIPRVEWVTDTVYTPYNSAEVVFGENFYVAVNAESQYDVFKVLDNFGGAPSTVEPGLAQTSPSDAYYSTSDGYVWKYMYSVLAANWQKFATQLWMPIQPNANVAGNAVSGAIELVRVDTSGSNYDSTLANTFATSQISVGGNPLKFDLPNYASSNSGFYVGSALYIISGPGAGELKSIIDYNGAQRRVTTNGAFTTTPTSSSTYEITPNIVSVGDGSGFVARGLVNTATSNSMYKVEIINRGSDYSYVTLTVGGNTGGISNAAVLVPIYSPRGGHGANSASELGATAVCFGVSFANSESGVLPVDNDFRTIGIVKDVLYANVQLTLNASSVSGVFTPGVSISQPVSGATGVVTSFGGTILTITAAAGVFVTGDSVYTTGNTASGNVDSYEINTVAKNFTTFDQRFRYVVDYISGTFVEDEAVYQNNVSFANGVFHSNDATYLSLTKVRGTFNIGEPIVGVDSGAVANVVGRVPQDIVPFSGSVLYIENVNPIPRSNSQTEQLKILLKF